MKVIRKHSSCRMRDSDKLKFKPIRRKSTLKQRVEPTTPFIKEFEDREIIDKINKGRIIVTYGGMGSQWLIKSLGNWSKVARRVDNIFIPNYKYYLHGDPRAFKAIEWLDKNGLDVIKDGTFYKNFHHRSPSGFKPIFDYNKTLEDNVIGFYRKVQHESTKRGKDIWAVTIHSAQLKVFSKHNFENIIFFIRHPLHSFLSYAKSTRHYTTVEKIPLEYEEQEVKHNKNAIKWWANEIWNPIVNEYFKLKKMDLNPILIRYEFADIDSGGYEKFYKGLCMGNRNDMENKESEEYIKKLVRKNYFKIYKLWEI